MSEKETRAINNFKHLLLYQMPKERRERERRGIERREENSRKESRGEEDGRRGLERREGEERGERSSQSFVIMRPDFLCP